MFLNEILASLHFHQVDGVNFGNFGDEVRVQFNGVVIRLVKRKLIMGFLREDTHKVFAPFRYDWFCCLDSLSDLGGDGGFTN